MPLLLKIDTNLDLDSLREKFAFEIVSEQEDGYVIVASENLQLAAFLKMIREFSTQIYGSATIASIHECEASSRVANPAQSLQALSVGSVAYGVFESGGWKSFAPDRTHPSAFSRSGFGIWDAIKPEVVEFGGDNLQTNANPPDVATPAIGRACYPELVRSTMFPPGPAVDRDQVGTSFAAPKVAHIAAHLQAILPDEPCLLYRSLIVQSARWPEWTQPVIEELQTLKTALEKLKRKKKKDWAVKKSNSLPPSFCIAVVGHEGWSHDPDASAQYVMSVSFEILGKQIPIYELQRIALDELQAEIETELSAEVQSEAEVDVPE